MGEHNYISQFLDRLQKIPTGNFFYAPRRQSKSRDFMLKQGLNHQDMVEELLRLEERDYYRGPTPDHNGSPGDVMEFTPDFLGIKVYIKLKIYTAKNGKDCCIIMSFHDDKNYD